MATYIVNFTWFSLMQDEVNGLTVIGNVQPVAHILSLPIYRQLLIRQRSRNNERDQLLRKMIRAVIIGTARNRDRKPIRALIGENKQVRTRFTRRIRT